MARLVSPGKPSSFTAVRLGTLAVFFTWLTVACYAIAYLIAH